MAAVLIATLFGAIEGVQNDCSVVCRLLLTPAGNAAAGAAFTGFPHDSLSAHPAQSLDSFSSVIDAALEQSATSHKYTTSNGASKGAAMKMPDFFFLT
jgi:hypothetical protein